MSDIPVMIPTRLVRLSAEPEALRMAVCPDDEASTPLAELKPLPPRPFFSTWTIDPNWREKLRDPGST